MRTARRSRRRPAGMALSPRENGRTHDRHDAGNRWVEWRRISRDNGRQAAVSGSLADPGTSLVRRLPATVAGLPAWGLPFSGRRQLMSRDHRKLRVFHDAHSLTLAIYNHTKGFPKEEWFGIRQQMRRAATSTPSNIVEGSARR